MELIDLMDQCVIQGEVEIRMENEDGDYLPVFKTNDFENEYYIKNNIIHSELRYMYHIDGVGLIIELSKKN